MSAIRINGSTQSFKTITAFSKHHNQKKPKTETVCLTFGSKSVKTKVSSKYKTAGTVLSVCFKLMPY